MIKEKARNLARTQSLRIRCDVKLNQHVREQDCLNKFGVIWTLR
jgi:hypothetical protein